MLQRSKAVLPPFCFLDVSSLNLAALQSAATFLALVQGAMSQANADVCGERGVKVQNFR